MMLTALLGTALVPLWMLALGPILLGVPHLLADVRYCVVRPGGHRRPALWIGVGLPLAMVVVLGGSAVGFAAVAGACAASSGSTVRRSIGIAVAVVAAVLCERFGPAATLVLVHLHNVVAVLLWWCWRSRRTNARDPRLVPLLMFTGISLFIGMGGLDAGVAALASWGPADASLGLAHHLGVLAPGVPAPWGLRLVLLFTFAQSVHYAIWLRLVPEDDRARSTPRSFRASYRALVSDLGRPVLLVTALLAVAVAGWALADLVAARAGYLRLARFHVFLELAVLAVLWTEGRRFLIVDSKR